MAKLLASTVGQILFNTEWGDVQVTETFYGAIVQTSSRGGYDHTSVIDKSARVVMANVYDSFVRTN